MADACYAFLRETKKALATLPDDLPDGSAELFSQQIADYDAETQHQRDAGLLSHDALTTRLQVQAVLRRWEGELRRANAAGTQEAFELLRGQFQTLADDREKLSRPPVPPWKQPLILWSRPLPRARKWWCSSPSSP